MATNYPANVDNGTTLPNPTGVNTQNNPDHALLHSNANDAIKALEAKVGTGASTPVVNTFLFGTGTGTSAWTTATSAQIAAAVSDETGTGLLVFATTPTLITPKVDTINENTPGNGTTIGGVNIKSGAITTTSSVPTAALQDSSVTSVKVAIGVPVQIVEANFTAVATGTTVIPTDDTIPQITEGTEFMTLAFTPKSATNKLSIEAIFFGGYSVSDRLQIALFQDATANALAGNAIFINTGNTEVTIPLRHSMVAGTTSSTTFRIRAGGNGAGTVTFNGTAAARRFGGITLSSIKITEYKV